MVLKMSETSQQSSENDGKCNRPHGSRKRQVHNEVERRRKDKINGWISKIAELLPRKDLNKPSKINILEQTVEYIKVLASERDKLLLENCTEVQAEEIRKLKKDLQLLAEQNALYVKLLEQSNISLNTLPRKAYKYSDKFVRKNGVLTAKNVESNINASVESAVEEENMCLNIPVSNVVSVNTPLTRDSVKTASNKSGKSCKSVTKNVSSSSTKPVKIASAAVNSSVAQPCVSTTSLQSNTIVNTSLVPQTVQQTSSISQENVIPVLNWNDPCRNSTAVHAGGVTTVLSQFPVMSTTLGSSYPSVYNKNVPTLIIPTGGNILQHFPAEKPSSTISIICPSTLPILVPQQVLSVPSVARNVGLPSTIICPGPVDSSSSPADKSAVGSTLLTINPSSVVPISSSFSANTRIILPSQTTLLGNTCGNVNLASNIMPPLLTSVTQNDDLIVPLVQKLPVSSPGKNSIVSNNSDDISCGNMQNTDSSITNHVENKLDQNQNIPVTTSVQVNTSVDSKASTNISAHASKKLTSRVMRNLCINSPPSLQVLSANKIISFANQTQNSKKLVLKAKSHDKIESSPVKENKPDESVDGCVQIERTVEHEIEKDKPKLAESNNKDSTVSCLKESTQTSDVSVAKSNFSLTVLMGDCLGLKSSPKDSKSSDPNQKSPEQDSPTVPVSTSSSNNTAFTSNISVESIQFSNVSESVQVTKENNFSSGHILSDVNTSGNNTSLDKENISNSKTLLSSNESFPNNTVSETFNNLSVSLSSSNISSNNHCHFNNLAVSSAVINTPPSNSKTQIISKENSESRNYSPKNLVQTVKTSNDQCQSHMCSEIVNSAGNTFTENVPYSVNESSINQALLPSLFSSSQIGLNSQVLLCQTGHENTAGIILSHGVQIANDSTSQSLHPCLVHDSNTNYQTFSVLSKDLPNSIAINSGISSSSSNDCNKIGGASKLEFSSENDCSKQLISSKKKIKSPHKESRIHSNDKNSANSESSCDVSNNTVGNKPQAIDNTTGFPKTDSASCGRQDSNFIFTSDILARATESIFSNDMIESPQMPKRNEGCFSDDTSNLPAIAADKVSDGNYKMQFSEAKEDQSASEVSDKSKKVMPVSDLQHSAVSSTTHGVQNEVRNIQESTSKQTKLCKVRKQKAAGDIEPPYKKLKEMTPGNEKSTVNIFSISHQSEKDSEKNISNVSSNNLSYLEKQVTSPSHSAVEDQAGVSAMGSFANHIHLSDNNCKTPSSVDAIFSLTPMLGDILKDVSHNVNLDSRSANFGTENQPVFSSEKNFISFNYPNNSNEDYLNLPRMYFPIIPEISSAPVVHVTNVSFAHSVSLCSTQSDSSKGTETHSSSDSQIKSNLKKKDILPVLHSNHNVLNLDLTSTSSMTKQSEYILKAGDSDSQFNVPSSKTSKSLQFEGQYSDGQTQSFSSMHSSNMAVSQSNNQYHPRDSFTTPVSHSISFYPSVSSSSGIQNFTGPATSSVSHVTYNNICNMGTASASFQTSVNSTNSFNSQTMPSKPDNLSHSLCSLLKENSSLVENRGGPNESSSQNSSSSNIAQSKYSALSLISDQTSYSEPASTTTCHQHFVQSSTVYTTSASDGQYVSTASSCSRNPKTSLSYSAESLLQTPCANSEKNKNNKNNNRFQIRASEKKVDRNNISNLHGMSDSNIFMPVTSCDINIQNAPLIPLPPVTSFHTFSSTYTACDTVPSTTIFNSVTRTQDIPLSLSNDNFLNHMNLNVESQMLSNRHEVSATVPKAHSNISLPFENHNTLYNNCNFLPHVKPSLESTRSSEASACFQPSSYSNNYTQQSQKSNCCHFTHRSSNSDISSDINLPASVTVASFHNEKNNFQNRPGLQTSFSQSNSNFMGNFFYNTPSSCHDGNERNDMSTKPSTVRPSQEMFVPEGVRQSIHDQNASNVFNSRKTVPPNRNKSKKPKNISSNENISVIPTCISNYSSSQDNSCNKPNISYVPNGYFKSTSHPVLPGQIQCSQNKINETVPSAVIPANPSFNPVLHQQSDNFLNLNFQHTNFTMSPLPRPPTQPLSCSCLTTPIISHTFSSSTPHPVPNFNLSNILPDMGCSGNQVSFSPAKFPMNHSLSSSSTQCQPSSTISNTAHVVSHQSCAPSLYPPHPPMVRSTLNPILAPNSQSIIDSQVSLVGTAGSVMSQNTTFTATQNPPFRNVIHTIAFPRNDR